MVVLTVGSKYVHVGRDLPNARVLYQFDVVSSDTPRCKDGVGNIDLYTLEDYGVMTKFTEAYSSLKTIFDQIKPWDRSKWSKSNTTSLQQACELLQSMVLDEAKGA